jgi:hypothetical protein
LNRISLLLSLALLWVLPCAAQTDATTQDEPPAAPAVAPTAKSPDEVKTLLLQAYDRNALQIASGPYHVLATFQTFKPDGQLDGEGSIERWATAEARIKTVTRYGDHTMTAYGDQGKNVYTDDGYTGSILSYYAQSFLFNALLPPPGIIHRQLQTTAVPLQGEILDCGGFQGWIEPPGYPAMPLDVFCVSRDKGDLALRQTERFSVRYQDYAPFLNQSIARRITASKGPHVRCRIKIVQLDQAVLDDAEMTAPPDASTTSPEPNIWATNRNETIPLKIGKVPVPPELKAAHASGLVEMFILISRTGSVTDVEPFLSTSPDLEDVAEQTVKAWTYKPILRNGKPIEVIRLERLPLQF